MIKKQDAGSLPAPTPLIKELHLELVVLRMDPAPPMAVHI
jgi:hypothetical protein